MGAIRNLGHWLRRFRYRCGYGVHSPYAFNFITGVIFERGQYYAYEVLDPVYGKGLLWRCSHECRRWHFLFRLANFVRPDYFLLDSGISVPEIAYLTAGSKKTVAVSLDQLDPVQGKSVLILASAENVVLSDFLMEIRKKAAPTSALLLHTDSRELRESCLSVIQNSSDCGVSFDLYDYLLVFFDLSLYKQHYLINFFD